MSRYRRFRYSEAAETMRKSRGNTGVCSKCGLQIAFGEDVLTISGNRRSLFYHQICYEQTQIDSGDPTDDGESLQLCLFFKGRSYDPRRISVLQQMRPRNITQHTCGIDKFS
ncbi:MAG: hypothetical protein LBH74_07165 [Nitrososphaerota archaeon]|nr:hypothetical protein [Nitrososphaerota archaeon]